MADDRVPPQERAPSREFLLRVAGVAGRPGAEGPAPSDAVEDVVRALDGSAHAAYDPATGILHVTSCLEVLEIAHALAKAGWDATAMTG